MGEDCAMLTVIFTYCYAYSVCLRISPLLSIMFPYVGNVQVMKKVRLLERLGDVESSSSVESGALIRNTGVDGFCLDYIFELSYEFFLIVRIFVLSNFETLFPLRN